MCSRFFPYEDYEYNNRVKKGGRFEGTLLQYLALGPYLDKEKNNIRKRDHSPICATHCVNALNKAW